MSKRILMVASENDALPNAKVGGIGDVVRDIPKALADCGASVQVVLPDYGHFGAMQHSEPAGDYVVTFAHRVERVRLLRLRSENHHHEGVTQWCLQHPFFSPKNDGRVYCDDDNNRPFATDATKYAFFCAAVAQVIAHGGFGELDVLHLHDWHAAILLVLRHFDPGLRTLKNIKTAYSIHNLSLQGVRPFKGDESAFETWFPHLQYSPHLICDPGAMHCLNPMRAGITLADKIHAVSPTYAEEITRPSNVSMGIYGGEGLEGDLVTAQGHRRLIGILNGCEYHENVKYPKLPKVKLVENLLEGVFKWAASDIKLESCHWLAEKRLQSCLAKKERGFVMTSVGRITDQKVRILFARYQNKSALEHILDELGESGVFILLGSGTPSLQRQLLKIAGAYKNFIYLQGYSPQISEDLYSTGDLFLMPSSFEPCGISQMLAMRAGQPCLVHAVGGLKDTVDDMQDGFCFEGDDIDAQAEALIMRFKEVLKFYSGNPSKYKAVAKAAQAKRFNWADTAQEYLEKLYN